MTFSKACSVLTSEVIDMNFGMRIQEKSNSHFGPKLSVSGDIGDLDPHLKVSDRGYFFGSQSQA